MFTQLRIQNFKSWADTGEFRMAPLTGFFGTNSSGKTAILQFLLMLKQTVESSDRNRILHLGGDQYSYVDLGTNYDISHRHQLPEKIKFGFEWIPKRINTPSLHLPRHRTDGGGSSSYILGYGDYEYSSLKFESVITIEEEKTKIDFFQYCFKAENNQWNSFCVRDSTRFDNDEKLTYKLNKHGNLFEYSESLQATNSQEPEDFYPLKNYSYKPTSISMAPQINTWLMTLVPAYEDLFQNTYYLAPLREYPKRIYLWSGENPQDIGKQGASAFSALLSSNKKHPQVQTAVAKALKELGLIDSFRLNSIAENRGYYEVLVKRSPNSAEVLITDVGFGVSQVLPILVLCYYAPKGATLIFEQPEIHLHPSVQAGLADIYIEVIKTRNIQIIIESHSEHLLRRLQRRMAEEKDGFTNDDAALYFCKMNDQGDSELVTLDIDDYGNICNYPEGFFGDEMGDLVAMTEAAINRQMNIGV